MIPTHGQNRLVRRLLEKEFENPSPLPPIYIWPHCPPRYLVSFSTRIIQQSIRQSVSHSTISRTHNTHSRHTQQHTDGHRTYNQPAHNCNQGTANTQSTYAAARAKHAPGSTRLPDSSNDAPYFAVVLRTYSRVQQSWTTSWGCANRSNDV